MAMAFTMRDFKNTRMPTVSWRLGLPEAGPAQLLHPCGRLQQYRGAGQPPPLPQHQHHRVLQVSRYLLVLIGSKQCVHCLLAGLLNMTNIIIKYLRRQCDNFLHFIENVFHKYSIQICNSVVSLIFTLSNTCVIYNLHLETCHEIFHLHYVSQID